MSSERDACLRKADEARQRARKQRSRRAWKAALIGAFVGVSSLLGYGTRWVLKGSFAIAVFAIAVALGLPPPDQWLQLVSQVQQAVLASRG